jgi:hypothetical protein
MALRVQGPLELQHIIILFLIEAVIGEEEVQPIQVKAHLGRGEGGMGEGVRKEM